MQQLHLVGFTTDLDSLIFSARKGAKSGGFVLPLDEALLATIADAVRRRIADGEDLEVPVEVLAPVAAPRRQSHLSPREIQDRLRAGRSLEAIAAEAGVGEEWVARFAAPVEAERSQIVGRARDLVYAKPRRGPSGEPLGLSVRWNLADRGVRLTNDEFDDSWSAYQVADHTWSVTFTFTSRKRTQSAEWEVDLATGELIGRGRLASDLGYVEPGKRRRSLSSLQPVPLLGTKGARRIGSSEARAAASDGADDDEDELDEGPARRSATTRAAAGGTRRPAAGSSRARGAAGKAPAAARRSATVTRAAGGRTSKAAASAARARKATGRAAKVPARATTAGRAAKVPARATTAGRAAKVPARATTAGRAAKVPARAATAGGRRTPAKKAAPRKTAAGRPTNRGGPPALPSSAVAPPAAAGPNELGLRRLQLVTGAPRPTGSGRRGAAPRAGPPPAPSAPRPAPVRIAAARSTEAAAAARSAGMPATPASLPGAPAVPGPSLRTPGPAAGSAPPAAAARDPRATPGAAAAAGRTGPAASAAAAAPAGPAGRAADPSASPSPTPIPRAPAAEADRPVASLPPARQAGAAARPPSVQAALDVADQRAVEERRAARRAERRAARAAAGGAAGDGADGGGGGRDRAAGARRSPAPPTARPAPAGGANDLPPGDGRVVTIRANRATPPTGEAGGEGEVVVLADHPPLRPAQPAVQPRRRRIGRGGR